MKLTPFINNNIATQKVYVHCPLVCLNSNQQNYVISFVLCLRSSSIFSYFNVKCQICKLCWCLVADVEVPQYRRCTKGQGHLRKEGPQIRYLSQILVLSRFTCFLKGHHTAFYESHPALGVFSTKVCLLSKGFQQKSARFRRAFVEPAFGKLLESFHRAFRELS